MPSNRRDFVALTGAAAANALSGAVGRQVEAPPETLAADVEAAAVLVGPESARPGVESDYISQFDTFHFLYIATDTAEVRHLSDDHAQWHDIVVNVVGDYSLDAAAVTPIGTADTYEPVVGSTTAGTTDQWTHVANNELRYDGEPEVVVTAIVDLAVSAQQATTVGVAIERFDAAGQSWGIIPQSEIEYPNEGGSVSQPAPTTANEYFQTGDKLRVVIKSVDIAEDLTVDSMTVNCRGR